jgi:hypothetical protein
MRTRLVAPASVRSVACADIIADWAVVAAATCVEAGDATGIGTAARIGEAIGTGTGAGAPFVGASGAAKAVPEASVRAAAVRANVRMRMVPTLEKSVRITGLVRFSRT